MFENKNVIHFVTNNRKQDRYGREKQYEKKFKYSLMQMKRCTPRTHMKKCFFFFPRGQLKLIY